MRGLNRAEIMGNLGADPEMRYTPNGRAVTNFRVAVNRRWRNAEGQPQEKTEWFRIAAWGPLAEVSNQYLARHEGR
jgi:single-strand DNA-binding protein